MCFTRNYYHFHVIITVHNVSDRAQYPSFYQLFLHQLTKTINSNRMCQILKQTDFRDKDEILMLAISIHSFLRQNGGCHKGVYLASASTKGPDG